LLLQFRGSVITSDGGLLAYRELDDVLGLTTSGGERLAETRTGRNRRHLLVGLLRQSVFGRLAGYEDVNDAERLCHDPAMRWVVGDRAITGSAASEPDGPLRDRVAGAARESRRSRRPARPVDRHRAPAASAEDDSARHRQPRALRYLPYGRGRGATADVPGNPVADRPAAGTRARQHERDIGADATDDGRGVPAAGRATRFSASARSTGDFDHLPCTREAICHCLRCPNGRPWPHNHPESGECRLNGVTYASMCSPQSRRRFG
jgi:hypothetical protein